MSYHGYGVLVFILLLNVFLINSKTIDYISIEISSMVNI